MPTYERHGGTGNGTHLSASNLGRLDRRTLLKTAAGSTAAVSLAGCLDTYQTIASGSDSEESITIGVLTPNPDSNFVGRSILESARVAVDELNEDGGINDRDVELVVGNTNESPTEARREYQRLVLDENVDMTTGVFNSPALLNIMDDIAEQETLHLTAGAATQIASRMVSEQYDDYKYHFRVGPTNDADLGRAQIHFLNDVAPQIGWDSVAVLAEDYPWADTPFDIVSDQINETPVDTAMEPRRYPPSVNDFSELYTEVAGTDADAVFIMAAHTGDEALAWWGDETLANTWAGGEPPFAFGGIHVPMQVPQYYELTDENCRYALGYGVGTEQSSAPETQQYVERYHDAVGSYPQDMGYYSYDAIHIFARAVEQADTVDSEALVPIIEGLSFTGASGEIEFYDSGHRYAHDPYQDDENPSGVYFQWQKNDEGDGVREIIWPEEEATAEDGYITPPWLE